MTEDSLHWHALNYRTAATQHAHEMFVALEDYVRRSSERTWQGLTEDEISKLVYSCDYDEYEELVRATEAKLKEKNT